MDLRSFPIKSNAVWLREVIDCKFRIPDYQRPYEWGEKNIDDFLTSLFEGYKEKTENELRFKPVFFGTIQLNKESKKYDDIDIVDGQQRLTTFLLFIDVLQKKQEQNDKFLECKEVISNNDEIKKAINESITNIKEMNNPSIYMLNKKILNDKVENYFQEFEKKESFYSDVKEYVLDNVFFVRLDTEEMDLSDVVSVFNTINTTGLDLNASDVFKFRYYEYLKQQDDDRIWMKKINDCYKYIEKNNEKCNPDGRTDQSMISMSWILDIYKHIICAQFGWGFSEVSKSNQRFFDELFKEKKYNKCPTEAIKVLEFSSFKNIVEEFVEFWRWAENARYNSSFPNEAMELFSGKMIEKSRYSRYWTIPYVVAYFQADGGSWKDYYMNSLKVNLCMFKLFTVYSVINDKVIYAIQNKVCDDCFKLFKTETIFNITLELKKILWSEIRWENDNPEKEFYDKLKAGLAFNGNRTHLICTLSALMDEIKDIGNEIEYKDREIEKRITISTKEIQDRLFNWRNNPYDIEHILAQNIFKDALKEDKELYNGIGNLVVLDRNINREIKDNSVAEKAKEYKKSKYISVQKHLLPKLENCTWNKETVEKRCEEEIEKIKSFMENDISLI